MEFKPSYFEDEVIDGFFVSGKMKHFWAAQLEVLDQIDKICREYGLTYYAECGTTLGTVRHGGFIPWDDDLDISMKRADVDKFLEVARDILPEGYAVFDLSSEEEYDNLLARVVNTRSICFEEDFMLANQGCPYAAGVDIFSLDNVGPTEELAKKQVDMINFCFSLSEALRGTDKLDPESWKMLRELADSCGIKFRSDMSVKKRVDLVGEWFMRMYNNEITPKITIMANYVSKPRYIFDRKLYDDVIYMPFENQKLPIAIGYEGILRAQYGDGYMRPIRRGSAHDYPGFNKQDDTMREAVGGVWCGYNFDKEALDDHTKLEKTTGGKSSEINQMADLLCSAQSMIRTSIENGQVDGLLDLLSQCQNLAMQLGEKLEADYPNQTKDIVTNLERYCELIFALYTYLTDDSSPEIDVSQTITSQEQEIATAREKIKEQIREKETILFLVSRAKWWHLLTGRYEEATKDENLDVKVMVVPWFEKNLRGELADMHYEKDEFPEDLPFIQYDQVALEKLLPYQIITQDPFENCTPSTSIHPYFYTSRIRKYTKKLTYISPYIVDDFGDDDERGFRSLGYCSKVPGVVLADEIVIQSDSIKKAYVGNLIELSGEEYEDYWNNIVTIDEYDDWKMSESVIRQFEDGKKRLCFHTSSSVLIKNHEKSIDKLNQIIDTFAENKEKIQVLWWIDSGTEDVLGGKLGSLNLLKAFTDMKSKLESEGIGKCLVDPDVSEIIHSCSAYYGDGSYVMNKFRRASRPIMQMDL